MSNADIYVKYVSGAYVTNTIGGKRASCTMSAQAAAERLAAKLLGDALERVEEVKEGNTFTTRWRAIAR